MSNWGNLWYYGVQECPTVCHLSTSWSVRALRASIGWQICRFATSYLQMSSLTSSTLGDAGSAGEYDTEGLIYILVETRSLCPVSVASAPIEIAWAKECLRRYVERSSPSRTENTTEPCNKGVPPESALQSSPPARRRTDGTAWACTAWQNITKYITILVI